MSRAISRRRISFTEDEIRYLIDIVDIWAEQHQTLTLEDDEVEYVHESMSTAIDVRDRLWRQLNG